MTRVLKSILLGLLALLLLLALALGLVLGTQAGSRWVLGLVPGLQVDDFDGRLGAPGKPAICVGQMATTVWNCWRRN